MDTDRDGLPDLVEVRRGGNALVDDLLEDADIDGVPTGEEVRWPLVPQMRNRDYLELAREARDRAVTFRCMLHLYHTRPKWRPPT